MMSTTFNKYIKKSTVSFRFFEKRKVVHAFMYDHNVINETPNKIFEHFYPILHNPHCCATPTEYTVLHFIKSCPQRSSLQDLPRYITCLVNKLPHKYPLKRTVKTMCSAKGVNTELKPKTSGLQQLHRTYLTTMLTI